MNFDKLMQTKVSRKKFLALLGGSIIAAPFVSKAVLAKTFLRQTDGTLLDIDDMGVWQRNGCTISPTCGGSHICTNSGNISASGYVVAGTTSKTFMGSS